MPSSTKRPRLLFSLAIGRSPWRTWISTWLWLSSAVEKVSLLRVGIVVLRGMSGGHHAALRLDAERQRRDVEQQDVLDVAARARRPGSAAPTATTSSGLTPLCGSLPPNSFLTSVLDGRHPRLAADEDDLVDVGRRDLRVLEGLARPARVVRSTRSSVSCSSLERVSVIWRWIGPDGAGRDERQVDLGRLGRRELDLRLLGGLADALQGHPVRGRGRCPVPS